MVRALDSKSGDSGLDPAQGHCVAFLGKKKHLQLLCAPKTSVNCKEGLL